MERVDLRRILRDPVSMLLAGAVAVGTIACRGGEAQASSALKPKCPTTAAELSYLVGGDPENWKPIEGIKGSWRFKSDVQQVLNGTRLGRVDTAIGGRINPIAFREATEAWYVCPDNREASEDSPQNPQ